MSATEDSITSKMTIPDSKDNKILLSSINHDLTNPINAILGYAELIIDYLEIGTDDRFISDVKNIHESGLLLFKIINTYFSNTDGENHEIIDEIISGEIIAGLIIHEGQLTYADYGLDVLLDLGSWWADENDGLPLPLGGNIVRNDLGDELMNKITEWTKMSIQHALDNPSAALKFAMQWGRGIDEDTNEKFVKMYVNDRTIDYGPDGRASMRKFLSDGQKIGMIDPDFDPQCLDFIGASSY